MLAFSALSTRPICAFPFVVTVVTPPVVAVRGPKIGGIRRLVHHLISSEQQRLTNEKMTLLAKMQRVETLRATKEKEEDPAIKLQREFATKTMTAILMAEV